LIRSILLLVTPKNSISPRRQELAFGGFTCKVWGARFSRKSMWAELLILIRTSVSHSLLVKESIYITSITPA